MWRKNGRNPNYRHTSFETAQNEAHRLASITPNVSFYILEALEKVRKDVTAEISLTAKQLRARAHAKQYFLTKLEKQYKAEEKKKKDSGKYLLPFITMAKTEAKTEDKTTLIVNKFSEALYAQKQEEWGKFFADFANYLKELKNDIRSVG